jgi:hypothetical protein
MQQQQRQQHGAYPRQQRQPRPEPPSLEEIAGVAARRIIRDTGTPDTVENWRAIKAAALVVLEGLTAPEEPEQT